MPRRAVLIYPIPPAPRTAVLAEHFVSKGNVRVFREGWTRETEQFAPQSIAGWLEQIDALAGVAHPTHALIVLRNEWDPPVSAEDHCRLWRAFGVPVFAQILAEDGSLLATECEAHSGLHIESRRFVAGDHETDRSPCACGKTSPRLIERVELRRAAMAAG